MAFLVYPRLAGRGGGGEGFKKIPPVTFCNQSLFNFHLVSNVMTSSDVIIISIQKSKYLEVSDLRKTANKR